MSVYRKVLSAMATRPSTTFLRPALRTTFEHDTSRYSSSVNKIPSRPIVLRNHFQTVGRANMHLRYTIDEPASSKTPGLDAIPDKSSLTVMDKIFFLRARIEFLEYTIRILVALKAIWVLCGIVRFFRARLSKKDGPKKDHEEVWADGWTGKD